MSPPFSAPWSSLLTLVVASETQLLQEVIILETNLSVDIAVGI